MRRYVALLKRFADQLAIHYCVRVSKRAKCPACGHRVEHRFVWSAVVSQLVHLCAVCGANWAEAPILNAATWSSPNVPPEAAQPETRSAVSREPIRVPPVE